MKIPDASQLTIAALLFVFAHSTAAQDVNAAQLLQDLKNLKDQSAQQIKAQKLRALQDVQAAAASPSSAAAAWEEAVRKVNFEGAGKEAAQFREWKEREGAGLDQKDGQNAARLYFMWLGLTLQRSAGTPIKDLLPNVIAYTKDATAAVSAIEGLEDRIKREREREQGQGGGRPGGRDRDRDRDRRNEDDQTRRIADQILRGSLVASPPVRALKIEDVVTPRESGAPPEQPGRPNQGGQGGQGGARDWEMVPGNVAGIFQKIVLPELRAQRDPRLLEYWEVTMRREADAASRSRLTHDIEVFNQVRRPELLWNRAEDELLLGHQSKALANMFAVIKAHPAHANAASWISKLESLLQPATAATTPAAAPLPVAPINPPSPPPAPAPTGNQ